MIPHSLNLSPGTDLLRQIKLYSGEKNIYGYVSSAVGNLRKACIQCPKKSSNNIYEGDLEVISLNGFFDKGKVHLHLCISDEDCNVYGGHLEEGSLVKKGADICLFSFDKNIEYLSKTNLTNDRNNIEIFVLNNCPWSKRAMRLLDSVNLKYQVKIVESDEDFSEVNKMSNQKTFPQIFINGTFFGGYDELNSQFRIDSLETFKNV